MVTGQLLCTSTVVLDIPHVEKLPLYVQSEHRCFNLRPLSIVLQSHTTVKLLATSSDDDFEHSV